MNNIKVVEQAIAKLVAQGAELSRIDFLIRVQERQMERNQNRKAD
jgi:hypothetical protein